MQYVNFRTYEDHFCEARPYKEERKEVQKAPLEKFLDTLEDLYQGGYISYDDHFKIVNNELRIDWPKFYPTLKKGVADGVTAYDTLTTKDLKKYIGTLDGVELRKRTRIGNKKPWCVSIKVDKAWGMEIITDVVRAS